MPIDFYYSESSPPCWLVRLLAKSIGVHFNLKVVDPSDMKPEFQKLNPQRALPAIDDGGFILCESTYAKNDSLYPKDPKKKGLVDQMLYFDIGQLFEKISQCYFPVVFEESSSVGEQDLRDVEYSCEILNKFLEDRVFAAGDTLTIADFAIYTTICVLQCFDFDISRYDNAAAWYNRCKQLLDKFGFEEIHAPGMKMFTDSYRAKLQESN
ncbi:glutathione S-transferase D5-like isoform X2 [Ceratina calcarata]|uniref:Glutathione S-transferase D5-like isoform X2 n=1 Tax=Ceratina calcarata TaxID=156304 RepID=A0AAJ7WFY3_9HYME|nr:glutathione S-transferase D5-like isoform X2 [Ceratina calcarata]